MTDQYDDPALQEFVNTYGGVYEHSPWVAERCFDPEGIVDRAQIAPVFRNCVDEAPMDVKLRLIRAHPDLAGRAAVRGELTAESTEEQSSAGLDKCTPEEYERLVQMNTEYKIRFGFPFIMAVRNSNRQQILDAFESRLGNEPETELQTAMDEIHKIAQLRLDAIHENQA